MKAHFNITLREATLSGVGPSGYGNKAPDLTRDIKPTTRHGAKTSGVTAPGAYGSKATDLTKNKVPNTRHKAQTGGRIRECNDEKDKAVDDLLKAILGAKLDKSHPISKRAQILYDCSRCNESTDEEIDDAIVGLISEMQDTGVPGDLDEGILGGLAAAAGVVAKYVAARAVGAGTASLASRAVGAFKGAQPKQPKVKTSNTSSVSSTGKIATSHPLLTKNNSQLRKGTPNVFKEAVEDACYGLHPKTARAFSALCEQLVEQGHLAPDDPQLVQMVAAARHTFLEQCAMQDVINVSKRLSGQTLSGDASVATNPLVKAAAEAINIGSPWGGRYPGGDLKYPNSEYIPPRNASASHTWKDADLDNKLNNSFYFDKWKD